MVIKHTVSVDFINRDSIQVVNFVQHDQNIPILSVDLYSGGSKFEVDLSSVKIYLRVSLPNGAFADIESTETSGDGTNPGWKSTVTFGLGYNVFPAYGAAKAIVLITEKAAGSTEYTNRAGSSPIVFMIDKDPIQDGSEESLDQYYGFRGYIEDVSKNVVKETALSIPKSGEYNPGRSWSYTPQVIIDKNGVVKSQKWYPTDLPGSGMPNEISTSGGSFVRRNSSKEILVPHKYTEGLETKTEYVPAISGNAVNKMFETFYTKIINNLFESLSAPYMFAVNTLPHTGDSIFLDVYITQKNGTTDSAEVTTGAAPKVVSNVASVRFKNESSYPITVEFVMNGMYTTLMVPGWSDDAGAGEETVILSGNMTVLAVNK